VPLYFYAGFNYYHPDKIGGVWPNLLDEHPLQYIYGKEAKPSAGLQRLTPHPDPLPVEGRGNSIRTVTPAWQSATSSQLLVERSDISTRPFEHSLSPQRGEGLKVRGENALDWSSVKSLGD
jgi:hypothetical protein